MNLFRYLTIAAALAAVAAMPAVAQQPVQGTASAQLQNFVRDSYIFQFSEQRVPPGQARARAAALVSQAGGALDHVYTVAYRGFSARVSSVAADNLFRNNDDVIGYSRDGIVSLVQNANAPGKNAGKKGGSSAAPAQTVPYGVTRVGGPLNGAGKTAWIIDTGIDLNHPDLNVDTSRAVSFVTTGKDRSNPDDQNGHGTHVSGTIAAIDNSIDVVGVAAGATVVPVRVLDRNGMGSVSGVMAGVDYVAQHGAPGDVANMSLGGGISAALDTSVMNAAATGVRFAIAAGNSSDDANNYSPARVNGQNIYTVSAIDKNDVFAYFSNYGNPPIDFAAPGVNVLSLWKGGGVTTLSGTSMATPHVAGLLLMGAVHSDGAAKNDPDGNPDLIAHH